MRWLARLSLLALANLVLAGVLLACIEGASSLLLVARDIRARGRVAERAHTAYDPDLGWANVPSAFVPDLYGPGASVRINAQGFRGDSVVSQRVPPGRVRLICSGDSFTFGYGVDNAHTFCAQLVGLDGRIETVNMGLGGYGVDQAYLWYKRDGARLDHDLHLLAVVGVDFERMLLDSFAGYGKPRLEVRDGQVAVIDAPVPPPTWVRAWLARSAPALQKLRTAELLRTVIGAAGRPVRDTDQGLGAWLRQVSSKVFDDLQRLNRQKGSVLVVALLPTRRDYQDDAVDYWREFLAAAAAAQGFVYADLIEPFRALPPLEVRRLFIQDSDTDYAGAAGHYTIAGNAWVAGELYRRLSGDARTAAKLSEGAPD